MAGSGKTTFVQRLNAYLHARKTPPYVINLDPAVHEVPYPANIDIRDTVNYKEVMKKYGLGPNGGIVTALNLFTTRFNEVMNFIDKRSSECKYVIFDTPGQIEVFTWSASGAIISESLASSYPTVIVYVLDSARCVSPVTFMSNMLYACSILYKMKLPFVVVMNKTDIVDHSFAVEWMKDFEAFEEALEQSVGVSSLLGLGIEEFLTVVEDARKEYLRQAVIEFLPELQRIRKEENDATTAKREAQLQQLQKDLQKGEEMPLRVTETKQQPDEPSDEEA
eukprot:Em0020g209a